jgi:alkylhydroperoxidase family enzyme
VGSHAAALRGQGADQELVDAIGTGDLSKVKLDPKDAALLTYVKLLTLEPAKTKDSDVQAMRDAGWTDEQIWEASFEVSLFSFLNRMADAHGLDYPKTGWYPPALREKLEKEKSDAGTVNQRDKERAGN